MSKYQRIGIRIAVATNVGVLVAVIALVVAWRNLGGWINFWPENQATVGALSDLRSLIEIYQQDKKTLPASLADLLHGRGAYVTFKLDANGSPLDGWGHPFTYSVDGGSYTIVSYGRDGKLGGVGPDYYLSNVGPPSIRANPTFSQFFLNPLARRILFTCFLCGVAAFWLSLTVVDPPALHGWAILALIVKLAVTILGTLAAAFFMSLFHIPNHH